MNLRHKVVTAGLVFSLVTPLVAGALPTVAMADPTTDLQQAAAELESLGNELGSYQSQLDEATRSLEDTSVQISQKQDQIEQTREQVAQRQAELGEGMRASYKAGSQSTLDLILGSTSVEDLVSRIYYLDRVSAHQADAISDVRQLQDQLNAEVGELERQRGDQQAQVDQMAQSVNDYQARVAEAQRIYDALDEQARAELAAQNNQAIQNAVDSVESNREQAQNSGPDASVTPQVPQPAPQQPQPSPQKPQRPEPEPQKPESGPNMAGQGVAAAYAQLGKRYVYGTAGPNTFDCSGLVCYCFGYARGRDTYSMIASLKATGDWKTDVSQLQVGDLVFPHAGHVGIYVGDGYFIHAANPTRGVVKDKVSSFIGGGSYY